MKSDPWLTEGALQELSAYIEKHPAPTILEFGSGASTLWFAQRTPYLISIEHDLIWYNLVEKNLVDGKDALHPVDLQRIETPYAWILDTFPDHHFDIILIDGWNRKSCLTKAMPKVKSGGILMLDDSQRKRYQGSVRKLDTWEKHSSILEGVDPYGSRSPNKTTTWWICPANRE